MSLPAKTLTAFGFAALVARAGWAEVAARPFDPLAHDKEARALVARMTVAEKVGQMTAADQQFLADETDIAEYGLGAVHSGGGSNPERNDPESWAALFERCRAQASHTRLRIPILYGIDAVHGHSNVVGAVIFPHNVGLGATRDAALVEEIGRVTALEMRATGINWDFAPVVAVAQDIRWGRTYESYSEDPTLAAELGAASVRGLQGADLADPHHVLACAKHFIGDGGTSWGTGMPDDRRLGQRFPLDRGDMRVDEATLRRVHLPPFEAVIAAGVHAIMPSYSAWSGERCSANRRLLTDLLKGELGFSGFLISDYDGIDGLPGDYPAQIKAAVEAGMDMFMVPRRYREFHDALQTLVEKGEIAVGRIDDAVTRILRVKLAMGLRDAKTAPGADRSLLSSFGSAEHRALARRAVSESLVLLKNDGVLPLHKDVKRLHVAGRSADDLGRQCGGWTVTWQSRSGSITLGTTIRAALEQAVSPKTELTFSTDGIGAAGAEAAVVVVGEAPYAEFLGDRSDLALSPEDAQTVARVKEAGVPTIVIVLSGRPLVLGDTMAKANALVAAWLPGSEGAGVADVLFGDARPAGKLPFSWPRSNEQLGHVAEDPLFPYGFGLSYPAAPDAGRAGFAGDYLILARDSGRAVSVPEGKAQEGAGLEIWDPRGAASHEDEWTIVPAGDGAYRLVNRAAGLAAAVEGDDAKDGARVVLRAAQGVPSGEWWIRPVGGGYYRLVNRVSGKALNVAAFGTANGSALIQWTYDGSTNSQFRIEALPATDGR